MTFDQLLPGDLVFQDQGETSFSTAVSAVVRGWQGRSIYHVGLYEGSGWIWEASREGVRRSQLVHWTGALIAGRLKASWRVQTSGLVERALAWVRQQEGLPYNETFDQAKSSFYCSELIIDAFRQAGAEVFHETPLTFRDPLTGAILPYWTQYYRERGKVVPEGQPGSHPAALSLSSELCVEPLTSC